MYFLLGILLFSSSVFALECDPVVEDNFSGQNNMNWTWRFDGTATVNPTKEGLEMVLPKYTPRTRKGHKRWNYSNSYFRDYNVEIPNPLRNLYRTGEAVLLNYFGNGIDIAKGSRGWGFWNATNVPTDSKFAWFMLMLVRLRFN